MHLYTVPLNTSLPSSAGKERLCHPLERAQRASTQSHLDGRGRHARPFFRQGPDTKIPRVVGPQVSVAATQLCHLCHRHTKVARDKMEMKGDGCVPITLSLHKWAAPARSGRRLERTSSRPKPLTSGLGQQISGLPSAVHAILAAHPHATHTQVLVHENCLLTSNSDSFPLFRDNKYL